MIKNKYFILCYVLLKKINGKTKKAFTIIIGIIKSVLLRGKKIVI